MKVGSIVAQTRDLVDLSGQSPPPEILGIVIEIHDWKTKEDDYPDEVSDFQKRWLEKLGRRIDVLWSSGKMTKSVAEASLRVIV